METVIQRVKNMKAIDWAVVGSIIIVLVFVLGGTFFGRFDQNVVDYFEDKKWDEVEVLDRHHFLVNLRGCHGDMIVEVWVRGDVGTRYYEACLDGDGKVIKVDRISRPVD